MNKKIGRIWRIKAPGENHEVKALSASLGNEFEPLANVLVQRNLKTLEEIKNWIPGFSISKCDPMQLKDMKVATKRLKLALEKKEKVFLFGDYDVDGTTAVATLSLGLKNAGWDVITYIPDRYIEGYGLSKKGIDKAIEEGASLLITLDCGIKALELVNYANEKSLDIIITDHHNPGETLPNALAVINPKRQDCSFPFKELSGCGVGYMLCIATYKSISLDPNKLNSLMDLVAISIGADMVPLTGINRYIVREGLKLMNMKPRQSITELLGENKGKPISLQEVLFAIGPKINAAGRMGHGHLAVELLTTPNPELLKKLSHEIERYNIERRSTQEKVYLEAETLAKESLNNLTLVINGKGWHKGVLGIVAQNLVEAFHKPTIVLTENEGILSGSARSVPGLNIYNALEDSSQHLLQFGGHHAAAGIKINIDKLQNFKNEFEHCVNKNWPKYKRIPEVLIDSIIDPEDLNDNLCSLLDKLAPYGIGNSSPVWGLNRVQMTKTSFLSSNKHLKTYLINPDSGKGILAIGFGWGSFRSKNNLVDVALELEWNYFRGERTRQARIIDIKDSI